MELIPCYFALSSSEDERSTRALVKLYLDKMSALGVVVEDAFVDCSCMQAITALLKEEGCQLDVHRCMQHVKTNISQAATKRDEASGKTRLSNRELLAPILDWVTLSSTLP